MKDLGHRQRRLLLDMVYYGQGAWPTGWRLRDTTAATLASLHRRQLVTSDTVEARLTSAGHQVVAWIKDDGL